MALILTALSMTICLTGCFYEELNVKLNKNGSGSVGMCVGFEKEFYNKNLCDSDVFKGKETTEIEYDGKTYITYTETTGYETFEDIEKALLEMTYDSDQFEGCFNNVSGEDEPAENEEQTGETVVGASDALFPEFTKDQHVFKSVSIKKDGSVYVFDAVLNKSESGFEGFDLDDTVKFNITVEMPAKVTAYKNGKVDGKKVTFDLSGGEKEVELYAECKTASKVPAIIGIVLALGATVAFFVIRKKK